jgi:hypothetical protein
MGVQVTFSVVSALSATVLAAASVGCEPRVRLSATGTAERTVLSFRIRGVAPQISSVTVAETINEPPRPICKLDAQGHTAPLAEWVYGSTPRGYRQVYACQQLRAGGRYVAFADVSGLIGLVHFSISSSGMINEIGAPY